VCVRSVTDRAAVERALGGPAEIAIVVVKSGATTIAATRARALVDVTCPVLSLQNGASHAAALHSLLGAQRVVLASTCVWC
jgi:ketopantoate reductase